MAENKISPQPQLLLPDHLVMSIFEYLPAKSLIKFRSLSKTFCSLIHKSPFVSAHLRHPPIPDPNKGPNVLYLFLMSSNSTRLTSYNETTGSPCPARDFSSDQEMFHVVGYCNGVVCLLGSDFRSFYIWNPLLNKSVKHTIDESRFLPSMCVGFGYDPTNNHFKFVRVFPDYKINHQLVVKLYTISGIGSTNTWRISSSTPPPQEYGVYDKFSSVYVNGASHWVGIREDDSDENFPCSIISFDMKDEVFQGLALPRPLNRQYRPISLGGITVTEFNGMLCVLPRWFNSNLPFIVWVMKVYGEAESWVPLLEFKLKIPKVLENDLYLTFRFVVVGWRNNGEELWSSQNYRPNLRVFNQKTQKPRVHVVIPERNKFQVFRGTYTESLALMDVEDGK